MFHNEQKTALKRAIKYRRQKETKATTSGDVFGSHDKMTTRRYKMQAIPFQLQNPGYG